MRSLHGGTYADKGKFFELEDSLTLGEIQKYKDEGRLAEIVIPIDQMFCTYSKVIVKKDWERLAYNGNAFPKQAAETENDIQDSEKVRVYDEKEAFIGVYQYREKSREYTIIKMFYLEDR